MPLSCEFPHRPRRPGSFRPALGATLLALAGVAAPVAHGLTIGLTGAGGAGGGYRNSLSFDAGGVSLVATAWSETGRESPSGSGYFGFQTAEIWSWGTGLGICNRLEGLAGSTCDDNEHEVDSVGRDDLLVLVFDRPVTFEAVTVDPYDGQGSDPNDRDIVYRVGNLAALPDLASYTFDSLDAIAGLGGERLSAALSSYSPFTHGLTGTGNVLLLSGNFLGRSCYAGNISGDSECEAYKITSISVMPGMPPQTVVPLPPAVGFLVSGLAALGLLRHRARKPG